VGPAVAGSPDVNVNAKPALRVGDPGVHAACCGPNTWTAKTGAPSVFINGKKAHRFSDVDKHCGGNGKMIEGSPDVIVGNYQAGGGRDGKPPPTFITYQLMSAFGGPLSDRKVRATGQTTGKVLNGRTDGEGVATFRKLDEQEEYDLELQLRDGSWVKWED